jgi:hypothetical protein
MNEYFEVEGFTGKYFCCKRYGTMSIASCTRNFTDAPRAVKAGRLEGCIGCQLGARHAGQPAATDPAGQEMTYRRVCVRCRRNGRESTSRLIGRMRLVRGHTICVSCYNREREFLHGANAKGATPKKWAGLHAAYGAWLCDKTVVRDRLPTPVADNIEVALTLVRRPRASAVMWAPAPVVRVMHA